MLYLYDRAIVNDLRQSFQQFDGTAVVKVVEPDGISSIAAQICEDAITFPLVALSRGPSTPIDSKRYNFAAAHSGLAATMDTRANNIYYEQVLPINLSYAMTVLATNTADMDEILRELIFKYSNMYFLGFRLPYESKRPIRFGIQLDLDAGIERSSGVFEYLTAGKLYQSVLSFNIHGAVLINYVPAHLKRISTEVGVDCT